MIEPVCYHTVSNCRARVRSRESNFRSTQEMETDILSAVTTTTQPYGWMTTWTLEKTAISVAVGHAKRLVRLGLFLYKKISSRLHN